MGDFDFGTIIQKITGVALSLVLVAAVAYVGWVVGSNLLCEWGERLLTLK